MAWGRPFLSRFTNSRCAGYLLFLDTYPDNPTNLSAAKPGFVLVNLERSCSLYIKRDNRYTSRIYQIYGKKIDYKKISLLLRYRYYPNTNLNRRLNNET